VDGLEEFGEFAGVAGGEEFDTAVGEVANPAGDVKAGGDLVDGVAEADALDAAFVEYLAGGHWEKFEIRNSKGVNETRTGCAESFEFFQRGSSAS
jgi:hypothetical protein